MQIYIAILGILISMLHPYNPAHSLDQTLQQPQEPSLSLKAVALVQALPEQQLSEQAYLQPQAVTAPLRAPQTPSPTISGCGDNEYAHFIYSHESGCVTDKYNSIGCYGIGQQCGHEHDAEHPFNCGADYTCQNAWFTDYANRAYGGWAGAYQFWLSHNWW